MLVTSPAYTFDSSYQEHSDDNASVLLIQLEYFLSRGESNKALQLLDNLPEDLLLSRPTFYMHYIWALLCERRFQEATIAREFFETNSYRILANCGGDEVKLFATNTAVLGLLQFIFENDLNAISAEAMERLKAYLDMPSHYHFMISNIYAFLLFMNGRYEKARYFAAKSKMANANKNDLYNYSVSNVLITLSDRALGRYDLAINGINKTLAELNHVQGTPACAISNMVKAMLLYDRNHLDDAKRIITHAIPQLGIPAITEFMVHGHLILARIEIWEQRFEKANELLNGLIAKLDSAGYERWSSAITHEQVKAALYVKDSSSTQYIAELDQSLNYYNSRYCPAVGHIPLRTQLMVALHRQQHEMATNLLGQLSQVCLLQRDSMLRIVLLSSTAVLEFSKGNKDEACEYLNQALRASQQSGITRALFDEVCGFDQLFSFARDGQLIDEDVSEDLIENLKQVNFNFAIQNRTAKNVECDDTTKKEASLNLSLDALTQTEQKILMLLAQGLPNKSIATQCNVNISTVKWHLKNIYSKLYVKNRTEAVIKAQQYQLVSA